MTRRKGEKENGEMLWRPDGEKELEGKGNRKHSKAAEMLGKLRTENISWISHCGGYSLLR